MLVLKLIDVRTRGHCGFAVKYVKFAMNTKRDNDSKFLPEVSISFFYNKWSRVLTTWCKTASFSMCIRLCKLIFLHWITLARKKFVQNRVQQTKRRRKHVLVLVNSVSQCHTISWDLVGDTEWRNRINRSLCEITDSKWNVHEIISKFWTALYLLLVWPH